MDKLNTQKKELEELKKSNLVNLTELNTKKDSLEVLVSQFNEEKAAVLLQ